MSGRRAAAALALVAAGALALGGCASGRLPETPGQRREAEIEELRARVVELARQAAVAESGIDADAYLYRDRTADAFLPWQIIDGTLKAAFFRKEFEKSLRAEWTRKSAASGSPVPASP